MPATKLEAQLLTDEGFKSKPYRDTVGKLTIGIGRNLDDVGITQDEAVVLLRGDVAKAQAQLAKALPWFSGLTDARKDALTNMGFNMGVPGLLKFTHTLALLQEARYKEASVEVLKSKWATQVGDRAKRIAKLIETGVYA